MRFAIDHRPYFEVMFRPVLYRADDRGMRSARERVAHVLVTSARRLSPSPAQDRLTTIAAWSLAHRFAGLWLSGSLPENAQGDPEAIARSLIQLVFGPMDTNASRRGPGTA
ncbi:TetR-like C-terminal domain-containing protein [Nonomuraea sp. CA-141351]|uniref:TetR-like C-terminal domain-containing protein n=1 Tax=Nonomuraea sp. CA-141351 TaxID=3239996 RepID=UPI003D8CB220